MWTYAQADIFVRPLLRKWGAGWHELGHKLQVALVDHEFTKVVISAESTVDGKVSIDDMRQLRANMREAAGLHK